MITSNTYEEILQYCKIRVRFKKVDDFIDYVDLAHNVISDFDFDENEYKSLVDKYIYADLTLKKNNVNYSENSIETTFVVEELWRCKDCQVEQPKSKFQSSWEICNKCYYKKNKERIKEVNLKSYLKHHEKRKAEKRQYGRKNRIENGDLIRRRDREYYQRNKDKILAKNKRCYLKNRDKRLLYLKEYYEKNKR